MLNERILWGLPANLRVANVRQGDMCKRETFKLSVYATN